MGLQVVVCLLCLFCVAGLLGALAPDHGGVGGALVLVAPLVACLCGAVVMAAWCGVSPGQLAASAFLWPAVCAAVAAIGNESLMAVNCGAAALVLGYLAYRAGLVGDRLRRRDARPGFCLTCRYDLIGNTTGVCPECGTSAVRTAGTL